MKKKGTNVEVGLAVVVMLGRERRKEIQSTFQPLRVMMVFSRGDLHSQPVPKDSVIVGEQEKEYVKDRNYDMPSCRFNIANNQCWCYTMHGF